MVAVLVLPVSVVAQSASYEGLLWLRYDIHLRLKHPKWALRAELEARHFYQGAKPDQFILPRLQATRQVRPWLTLGAGSSLILKALRTAPTASVSAWRFEMRPHQLLLFRHPVGHRWQLWHRFRFEERFAQRKTLEEQTAGCKYYTRLRYLLAAHTQWGGPNQNHWKLELGLEALLQLSPKLATPTGPLEQIRTRIGVARRVGANVEIQLDYQTWTQPRAPQLGLLNRHIARLTLRHFIRPESSVPNSDRLPG